MIDRLWFDAKVNVEEGLLVAFGGDGELNCFDDWFSRHTSYVRRVHLHSVLLESVGQQHIEVSFVSNTWETFLDELADGPGEVDLR